MSTFHLLTEIMIKVAQHPPSLPERLEAYDNKGAGYSLLWPLAGCCPSPKQGRCLNRVLNMVSVSKVSLEIFLHPMGQKPPWPQEVLPTFSLGKCSCSDVSL